MYTIIVGGGQGGAPLAAILLAYKHPGMAFDNNT